MKPHFTTYIPVEEEIKKGDYVKDSIGIYQVNSFEGLKAVNNVPHIKKVELFLCSKDIQVGDIGYAPITGERYLVGKITRNLGNGLYEIDNTPCKPIKLIGKVSPEATWITEGMEFDEDDWLVRKLYFNPHNLSWTDKSFAGMQYSRSKEYIVFRCPSSPKHFH